MKKYYFLLIPLTIIIFIIIIFTGNKNKEEGVYNQLNNFEETTDNNDLNENYLDMQGYYLYPPDNYNCQGGFTDYRYLDAKCLPKNRDDYTIEVGAGLASSRIDWDEGRLIANQIGVRSFEFTGGQYGKIVCEEFKSDDLNLDAEHYLCSYLKEDKKIFTLGVGKSFYLENASFGRWFEANLIVEEENNYYSNSDYVNTLVNFINKSIKINWEDYAPDN